MVFLREMTSLFHSVAAWWTSHPGWNAFIYFVIAIYAGCYNERAKRFLTLPIAIPARGLWWLARRDMTTQLQVIRSVRDNPYKLILYISYYCADAVIWSGILAGGG